MFDLKAFRKAEFTPREVEIDFPALAEFGGKFKVRGLTATEIAQADEAAQKGKLLSDLVEKLAGASGKKKAAALLEGVGISDDLPALLAKRIEHVVAGVVEPKLEHADVAKLGDAFPIEFSQLANKILELTGQGQVADVKRLGSTKEPT
ncbi:hypothetical protein A3765_13910 [Oleiphilus sp. HI0130]|nr:hypothetical protein A3765_13910 [Oleiphilus sp. HI0130]